MAPFDYVPLHFRLVADSVSGKRAILLGSPSASRDQTVENESEKVITIEHIQRKASEFFGLKLSDMRATTRTRAIAFPRQIAMYLARQLTHASLTEVGRAFGKDHTTVLHAVAKIQALILDDPKLKKTVTTLTEGIAT